MYQRHHYIIFKGKCNIKRKNPNCPLLIQDKGDKIGLVGYLVLIIINIHDVLMKTTQLSISWFEERLYCFTLKGAL